MKNVLNQFTSSIVVDLDAIAANTRAIKTHIGPDVSLFGVVKAYGYGHGAVPVARVMLENGAERLCVGRTDEGIELRRAGIDAPVLNLCYTVPGEADDIVEHDLIGTVNTVEGAEAISARAGALGKTATVHVKVDTGMGRFGQLPGEMVAFLRSISGLPNLNIEGIWTHFSSADEADRTYTESQIAAFNMTLNLLAEAGYHFEMRHAANSAGTLDYPEAHFDAVRPGLIMFGMYPSADVSRDVSLVPAMTLRSHLARVRVLPKGSAVSYGRTYTAPKDTRIGLVPIGYGDGYHRVLSNRGHVLVRGKVAPIVGRVCMDQFMVDLSAIPDARQDDEVVIIGKQGGAAVPAEEVAAAAGTINYEITTALARRLPRLYTKGGSVVEVGQLPTCQNNRAASRATL